MSLIPEEHQGHLKAELNEKMIDPVRILMFTQEIECQFCSETRQLLNEIATLNDKIKIEFYDFVANADRAKELNVDKIPAIVFIGQKDYGIRFYGFPYGYELRTLIDTLITVSTGKTDLLDQTKDRLREVKSLVHIQVFVTLTCPHCSSAVLTAYKFAMENPMIRADAIDANEFLELALKHAVIGVPKIVINENIEFVGALPDNLFLEQVLLAAQQAKDSATQASL